MGRLVVVARDQVRAEGPECPGVRVVRDPDGVSGGGATDVAHATDNGAWALGAVRHRRAVAIVALAGGVRSADPDKGPHE